MTTEKYSNRQQFYEALRYPLIFLAMMWMVHICKVFTDWDFVYGGIFPRKSYGLLGILTAPLIHGDWKHLFSNSIPFLGLGVVCMYFYRSIALKGFAMIYILTGLAVWLLGNFFDDNIYSNVSHIGASGVVYGLVAFVFWNGIFVRSPRAIVLALVVLVLYSGMFEGILPNQEGISWESHLFGGLVGIFTAYFYKGELLAEIEASKNHTWGDQFRASANKTRHFLDRDVFEKTKEERRREEQERQSGWDSTSTWE